MSTATEKLAKLGTAISGVGTALLSAGAITQYVDLPSAVAGSGSLITAAGSDKMLSFGGNIINILVDNMFGVVGLILAIVGIAYFIYRKVSSAVAPKVGG